MEAEFAFLRSSSPSLVNHCVFCAEYQNLFPTLDLAAFCRAVSNSRFTVIVGANRSGKSLLLHLLADYQHATSDLMRACMTFEENEHKPLVSSLSEILSCPAEESQDILMRCGLNSLPDHLKPFTVLSCGQQERVLLSLKLSGKKSHILIDDFGATLDVHHAQSVAAAVPRLIRDRSLSNVVVATHRKELIPFLQPELLVVVERSQALGAFHVTYCLNQGLCSAPASSISSSSSSSSCSSSFSCAAVSADSSSDSEMHNLSSSEASSSSASFSVVRPRIDMRLHLDETDSATEVRSFQFKVCGALLLSSFFTFLLFFHSLQMLGDIRYRVVSQKRAKQLLLSASSSSKIAPLTLTCPIEIDSFAEKAMQAFAPEAKQQFFKQGCAVFVPPLFIPVDRFPQLSAVIASSSSSSSSSRSAKSNELIVLDEDEEMKDAEEKAEEKKEQKEETEKPWRIGLVLGSSGCGKTSILKAIAKDRPAASSSSSGFSWLDAMLAENDEDSAASVSSISYPFFGSDSWRRIQDEIPIKQQLMDLIGCKPSSSSSSSSRTRSSSKKPAAASAAASSALDENVVDSLLASVCVSHAFCECCRTFLFCAVVFPSG